MSQIPRLGVISALDLEASRLRETLDAVSTSFHDFRRFDAGLIGDTPVVLTVTGPGKVNAAMTAQALFTAFKVVECVVSGIGGSLGPAEVGDVLVAETAVYHDYGTWSDAGWTDSEVLVKFPPRYRRRHVPMFRASPSLVRDLADAARGQRHEGAVLSGTMATGDQFIASSAERAAIRTRTGAIAVDMETASVAQVAYLNEVPWGAVRVMSDAAGAGSADAFGKFLDQAARRTAAVLEEVCRRRGRHKTKETIVAADSITVEPRAVELELELPLEVRDHVERALERPIRQLDLAEADVRRIVHPVRIETD